MPSRNCCEGVDAGIRLTAERVVSYDRSRSQAVFAETAANLDRASSGAHEDE